MEDENGDGEQHYVLDAGDESGVAQVEFGEAIDPQEGGYCIGSKAGHDERWGARPVRLAYLTYSPNGAPAGPPDRGRLSPLVALWRAAPAFVTDFAGPRLIKYLLP